MVDGHKQMVLVGKFDAQELLQYALMSALDQSGELANAIIHMHHPISRFEVGVAGFGGLCSRAVTPPGLRARPAKNLAVR